MSIDKQTVARVAHLARINVPKDRLTPLSAELDTIVQWIEQLEEVDTDGVMPMASAVEMTSVWREDKVTDGGYAPRVIKNAPAPEKAFFTVPKVVE